MVTIDSKQPTRNVRPISKHNWYPRIWFGCDLKAWMKLLSQGSLSVDWPFVPLTCCITAATIFNTVWHWRQELQYGRLVAATEVKLPPLFIVGHWRTGTTYVHELLALDKRHAYPTTYECMSPNHFLASEAFVSRRFGFVLPSRRPMDNMHLHWQSPQEDEFALCNMGQPSPYLMFAFPDHIRRFEKYFCLDCLTAKELEEWKGALLRFIKQITFNTHKRVILKSPPHTFRIKHILDIFPDALFVHIVRNPIAVIPSTINMLKALSRVQSLQQSTFAELEEFVFDTFNRMHEKFEEGRTLISASRFYEVRYEDLLRDPVGHIRDMYCHLRLEDYEEFEPILANHLANTASYKTNRYELPPEMQAAIRRRCEPYMKRHGYI